MSRVTIAEWYKRVGAAWPEKVPALSEDEAVRAAKRLYRFVMRRRCTMPVRTTSGHRYSYRRSGELVVNPSRGWKDLVHELSHDFFRDLEPTIKPHSGYHARLELRMIKQVIKRGWLQGTLKTPEKQKHEPSEAEVVAVKRAKLQARLKSWQSKERRAHKAAIKIERQINRLDRQRERVATSSLVSAALSA